MEVTDEEDMLNCFDELLIYGEFVLFLFCRLHLTTLLLFGTHCAFFLCNTFGTENGTILEKECGPTD